MNHARQSHQRHLRALNSQLSTLNSQLPRGFTLVELMIVVAIIILLVAITVAAVGNLGQKAKEAATVATITKLHRLLEQRVEAFDRKMTEIENRHNKPPEYDRALQIRRGALIQQGISFSDEQLQILVRKDLMKQNFPQRPGEKALQGNTASQADSAELLYFFLTQAEVGGAPPVDAGEFEASAVGDTDGDGLLELLDGWGQPLRFYRWPTRLFKPEGEHGHQGHGHHDEELAGLLVQGLAAHSTTGIDMLDQDPDDPLGRLDPVILQMGGGDYQAGAVAFEVQHQYHTPNTFHAPLIVSAGADGNLGLLEPTDVQNLGHLAKPDGDVGDPGNPGADRADVIDALSDNITNRNRRAGQN